MLPKLKLKDMDIVKELKELINMHYSGELYSSDDWLREIIDLKCRIENKKN